MKVRIIAFLKKLARFIVKNSHYIISSAAVFYFFSVDFLAKVYEKLLIPYIGWDSYMDGSNILLDSSDISPLTVQETITGYVTSSIVGAAYVLFFAILFIIMSNFLKDMRHHILLKIFKVKEKDIDRVLDFFEGEVSNISEMSKWW